MKNPIRNCRVVGANVTGEAYRAMSGPRGDVSFVMSRSDLLEFYACPSKWMAGIPRRQTKAMRWGTIMDVRATGQFASSIVTQPSTYTNSKGQVADFTMKSVTCRSWVEEQEAKGLIVISDSERIEVSKAWRRIEEDRDGIANVIAQSSKQVMVVGEYHDDASGLVVPIKSLIDLVPLKDDATFGKSLADFKTTRSAEPRSWRRDVWAHGYDVQAWQYLTMYADATGEERIEFFHVVQENSAPYELAKRMLTEEFIRRGEAVWMAAMKLYCQCLRTDTWPTYDDAERKWGPFAFVEPEPWMMDIGKRFSMPEQSEPVVEPEEGEIVP